MKIKSSVAILVGAAMLLAVGPIQAACESHQPGWHMVSKKCNIRPADNWQEYASGVYIQPQTGQSLFYTSNR